jgi:hypothetical protein
MLDQVRRAKSLLSALQGQLTKLCLAAFHCLLMSGLAY